MDVLLGEMFKGTKKETHSLDSTNPIQLFAQRTQKKILEGKLENLDKQLFVFPEENRIAWTQDFHYFSNNAPSSVEFRIEKFLNPKRVSLIAAGYGGNPYGNGSIYVDLEAIIEYGIFN